MKRSDTRETKCLFINGYIYTLVRGASDRGCRHSDFDKPHFMGYPNWALHSIIKMKRKNPPKKKKS